MSEPSKEAMEAAANIRNPNVFVLADGDRVAFIIDAAMKSLRDENKRLELKCKNSLANNLCSDHRDKQAGKTCLACQVETLKRACQAAADFWEGTDAPTEKMCRDALASTETAP